MTNAQKWIAIFLGFFLLLFAITYLTEPSGNNSMNEVDNTEKITGADLYNSLNCADCHGKNMEGTNMAPSLLGLKANWSKTELINYLRNPSDYRNTDRIKKLHKKYPNSIMPQFDGTDVKKLGILAEYLLSK